MTFLKNLLTSCLGSMLGLVVFTILGISIIAGLAGGEKSSKIENNSVLKLTFDKPMPELTGNVESEGFSAFADLMNNTHVGLADFCALIDKAIEDNKIKGIYMELSNVPMGWASLKVVREKLLQFKAAGKFIVAYSTGMNQRSYSLATVADQIYLHPLGGIEFLGYSAGLTYYKGLMDKVGVKAQIYYAGKFKSATEPFRRMDMSPENRLQTSEFIHGAYNLYLQSIADARKISVDELRKIANEALIRRAEDAVTFKMVDGLKYKDEVLADLRSRLGIGEKEDIRAVNLQDYYDAQKGELHTSKSKNKIAIVFAEGSIIDGEGENGSIGGDKYAREIREIRKDENVKAIVLRINSGGGSALASDIIWRELEQAKAQGIQVIASMGDVAASGGYYIACNAHRIYAENNTITGSIGVFGMIPNMRGLYQDKLGLTMDTIKTGKYSTMMSEASLYYEFSPEESALIQQSVEDIYMTFKKRVSDGRKMDIALVDSLAQGRVWLGNRAQQIGLVDSLGGLSQAVAEAARLANVTEYDLAHYPAPKNWQEEFFAMGNDKKSEYQSMVQKMQTQAAEANMEELRPLFRMMRDIRRMKGVQMRMPYELTID